jgi:DNA-binding helix-turn-helix protein
MNLRKAFGHKLKSLRKQRNMSQEHFAELADISPGSVRSIECGVRFPGPENIVKFASILNIKIKDLFDIENDIIFSADDNLIASISGLNDNEKAFLSKTIELYKQNKK